MGLSLPSIPGLSTVRDAAVSTVTSAASGLRDFSESALTRTTELGSAGLDLGRRAVDAVGRFDVRDAAATVRGAIGSATESAREGIRTGTEWAGQQTHQAAEFARSHVTGDDLASRALRGTITAAETTTRFQLGVTGGIAREVVGLAGTVGELGTTGLEMQLSPEARLDYGQRIVDGAASLATGAGSYASSVAHDPSRIGGDISRAVDAGGQFVDGQLGRYEQAIREGRGPETIGMDVGTVATYLVPVGGGPARGAVTAAARGAGETAVRTGAEVVARETAEAAGRGGAEAVAPRLAAEAATPGVRAAESASLAGRSLEQVSTQLRGVTQTQLETLRAAGVSNKKLGPAISAVMDVTTGKVSTVFTNDLAGRVPANLNPALASRLEAARGVDYIKTSGAGSHAEVYAANELLNSGSRLENLVVYTQEVKGARAGEIKPPCPHCALLLEGATYAK